MIVNFSDTLKSDFVFVKTAKKICWFYFHFLQTSGFFSHHNFKSLGILTYLFRHILCPGGATRELEEETLQLWSLCARVSVFMDMFNMHSTFKKYLLFRKQTRDSAGSPMVKDLPCSARDLGSILGWGTKISHTAEQLSLHATTTEPACSGGHAP